MKPSFQAWLWAALSLGVLAFIFGNSLQTADISSAASGSVVDWLAPILEHTALDEQQTTFLIRKLAHFSEFALLGLCLCGTAYGFALIRPVLCAACAGALAAGADEFIQRFVEGRSSQFTDVMLDTAGVLFGLCLYLLLRHIMRRAVRSAS